MSKTISLQTVIRAIRWTSLFAILAFCGVASAAVITVTNPTFTATLDQPLTFNSVNYNTGDPIPQGTYEGGTGTGKQLFDESNDLAISGHTASFAGWTPLDNRNGVLDPAEVTSGFADAGNVGFMTTWTFGSAFNGETSLAQEVPGAVQFQPNTTYVLSVQLLHKNVTGLGVSPVFFADLTAGGVRVNGTQVLVNPTSATLGSDTVTFTTGALAPSGNLGIILDAKDTSGNLSQMLVDNLALTSTPVPEPATLGAILLIAAPIALTRRYRKLGRAALCLAGLLVAGAIQTTASAAVIAVTNPGFTATVNNTFIYNSTTYHPGDALPQDLYLNSFAGGSTGFVRKISDDTVVTDTSSGFVTATVTGWTSTHARAGVANFSGLGDVGNLVTFNAGGFDGTNVGFTQTLPGSVQLLPDSTYTLSMTLRSLTIPFSPIFTTDLTVGGTPVGGTLVLTPPANDSTPGSAVVTYMTGSSPLVGNLGIRLLATDSSGNISKVIVDDMSLTVVATPEPASIGVLAIGSVVALRRGRRS